MPDVTTSLGLKKPLGNETVSRAAYNENLDILDAAVVKKSDFASHKSRHSTGGADALTPADIGAASAGDLASHLADYAYQTPTIVGTQIQITRQSDTKRLYIYLDADLTGGAITISLDAGDTSLPLKDIEGNALTELSKGFVEVVDNTTFFTLRPRGGGLDDFFGDGSDGDLDTTGNVTYSVTADTGYCVKQFKSVKINTGHTVTVNNACRGLIFLVQGDCTIQGTLDMSKKGGLSTTNIPVPVLAPFLAGTGLKGSVMQFPTSLLFGGVGGNGGQAPTAGSPSAPTAGFKRLCAGSFGAGGQGGGCASISYGNGGSITTPDFTVISNGANRGVHISTNGYNTQVTQPSTGTNGAGGGGSAQASSSDNYSNTATAYGGYGGNRLVAGGGGGGHASCVTLSQNATATASNGGSGEYGGGFIALIVKGNLTVSSGGYIKANGGNGGAGGNAAVYYYAGDENAVGHGGSGGGGSGGGVIILMHKGSFTNNGTIQANGGSGGAGGAKAGGHYQATNGNPGQSGGVGTITEVQM